MNSNLFESSQIRVIPSSQIRNRFFRRGVPPSHDRGRERPSASAVTRSEAALHGAHDSPGHVSTGPGESVRAVGDRPKVLRRVGAEAAGAGRRRPQGAGDSDQWTTMLRVYTCFTPFTSIGLKGRHAGNCASADVRRMSGARTARRPRAGR